MSVTLDDFHGVRTLFAKGIVPARGLSAERARECGAQMRLLEFTSADWNVIVEAVREYVAAVPTVTLAWPPPLPFPCVWVTSTLPKPLVAIPGLDPQGFLGSELVGILADERGLWMVIASREDTALGIVPVYADGKLEYEEGREITLTVRALLGILDAAHCTVVKTGLSAAQQRSIAHKTKAPWSCVPKEFYRVNVIDRLRWEGEALRSIASSGPVWRVGHRHDVRGHWRVLVQRGKLAELTEKVNTSLLRRGYEITTGFDDPFTDELDELVRSRGIRRRDGEYLAALKVRVQPCIRGPADRPYVPSTWRARMRRLNIHE